MGAGRGNPEQQTPIPALDRFVAALLAMTIETEALSPDCPGDPCRS
jgi:hypothetical protein